MTRQFLRVLPFYSQPVGGEPVLRSFLPVALWRCRENSCEGQGPDSPCDDSEGLHYTIAGDGGTYWCPRHWYEMHCHPQADQRLVPMTEEQHRQECAAHRHRLETTWRHAEEQIQHAARKLSGGGLSDEAGRLHEACGAIRARVQTL